MEHRKEFMLIFRYEPTQNYQPSEAEMADMHQSWGEFIGNIAIQEKLVSTHQLGFEGTEIFPDSSVTEGIHISDKLMVAGNMIVSANSLQEAVELAKNCPILGMGGRVEVRSIQPM
jgi:hypothetical protein